MVDRPAEVVWKAITDLSNPKTIDPHCLDAKQTSAGPFGVGTTFQLTRSSVPKKPNFQVTEYEPNTKVSFAFTSGPVKGTTQQFRLETVEGKTKLTRSVDGNYSGIYKLVGPFMTGSLRRQADLSNTKRILESEAKS